MIPELIFLPGALWPVLPPGIHDATLSAVFKRFALNERRIQLFEGLKMGLQNLFSSGCSQVFLDGSYVTAKPVPADYEVCWDVQAVDPSMLDPIFLEFADGRASQKKKYLGEYFPATIREAKSGKPFLEFFQKDKETGKSKGIIRIINYL